MSRRPSYQFIPLKMVQNVMTNRIHSDMYATYIHSLCTFFNHFIASFQSREIAPMMKLTSEISTALSLNNSRPNVLGMILRSYKFNWTLPSQQKADTRTWLQQNFPIPMNREIFIIAWVLAPKETVI